MTTHRASFCAFAWASQLVGLALALALVAAGCKEREVVYEPLWQGDVISPSFGDGASSVDAAGDGVAAGDGAAGDAANDMVVGDAAALADALAGDSAQPDASFDTIDAADATDGGASDTTVADTAGGNDTATATDTGGSGDVVGDTGPVIPTSFIIWSEVLQPWGCTSAACHGSKTQWPLFVDPFSFRALLVGKAATGPCAPGILVKPADPDGSILIHKIDPKVSSCGLEMPTTGGVDAATVKLLRAWISAGAPP